MDASTNEKEPSVKDRIKYFAKRINLGESGDDEFPFDKVDTWFVLCVLEGFDGENPERMTVGRFEPVSHYYKTTEVHMWQLKGNKSITFEFLEKFLGIEMYSTYVSDFGNGSYSSYNFRLETDEEGVLKRFIDLSILDLLEEPTEV